MTLAQLGADVIRFDNVGGGIDYHRWPCTPNGDSLFWASMNKGKRSFAVDVRNRDGQALVTRLITAPGPDRAQAGRTVVQGAGQHHGDRARSQGSGGGPEQHVDRRAVPVFLGAPGEQHRVVHDHEVVIGSGDQDDSRLQLILVRGQPHLQRGAPGENRRQRVPPARRDVQDDENPAGEVRR
jgi:hypothetical protein